MTFRTTVQATVLGCVLALVIAGTALIAFVDGGRANPYEAVRPLARYVARMLEWRS